MIDQQGAVAPIKVPYFRAALTETEVNEVVACLRSGWLTTGPRVQEFERRFAQAVGAEHAIAVNSCTAALHLALEAVGLKPGQAVLVPTLTFAATAEVVRYQGAVPVLVDCDPLTGNIDLSDAADKLRRIRAGRPVAQVPAGLTVVGILPVHLGGNMLDMSKVAAFAEGNDLWVIEDAAHAFPAAWRPTASSPWQHCGASTALITCFSFYANKTLTTGEGGMAVTGDAALAERMRLMSLHGLSRDAWSRYSGGSWDYRIVAPGYKYNLTDVAAAIGLGQLQRGEEMRRQREAIARAYLAALAALDTLELPIDDPDRILSWHLFPIRLQLERLSIDRNVFFDRLRDAGVSCSVHWRPLHLHPYYEQTFGWQESDCPTASELWPRLISLPIFPDMRRDEIAAVVQAVQDTCRQYTTGSISDAVA